ncbi:MAG TPA: NAD(P)-dependent oxidoreductase [Ferruginibacter sp.]|jgi:nucleoside-diphosphate-sugar epimerase|nr:NAD(P)-dependent oxidoreductase [Ferruginibacter sp.]HQV44603.1 NAD(P)-dependent oxidoreductase [Ferruginibacter sp.]HQW62891.1 NAD(P)-dependent oxidoreductase [Ferruginibacter sp.]HQY17554.1 NAD(P)-dependent oxidoreductase [Ferruginibacter sp.]HQY40565.1 NAD(P)-dependent oxidoreductase [Ferruginibacter sp.]
MKRVLITGANGFLGFHLINAALAQKFEVFAGLRKNSKAEHLSQLPIQYSYLNYENVEDLTKEIADKKINYIIHAAGTTKALKQQVFEQVNVAYTVNLAKAAQMSGNSFLKMVFISSLAAVGPLKANEGIITEKTFPSPLTSYGKSKLLAERKLAELDIESVILRPTAIYGPREKEIFVIIKTLLKGIDANIGSKPQKLSFVYASDVADAAINALLSNAKAVFNISDGNSYSKYDFADALKHIVNKKALRMHLPQSAVHSLAHSLEKFNGWLNKPTMLSREKLKELVAENWICDISKAKQELNFIPKFNLETGLQETIEWYRQNNWI